MLMSVLKIEKEPEELKKVLARLIFKVSGLKLAFLNLRKSDN